MTALPAGNSPICYMLSDANQSINQSISQSVTKYLTYSDQKLTWSQFSLPYKSNWKYNKYRHNAIDEANFRL